MKSKIEKLYEEVSGYKELTLKDNIECRLQKTLLLYLEELDNASDRVLGKKVTTVYKELGK